MALPIVAVVGRPNVGKSTLVNRIAQGSDAIVHAARGVTRDRSYHQADWNGQDFLLIDTGGIESAKNDPFAESISSQAQTAATEADVIVLLVDASTGIAPGDQEVARLFRSIDKPIFLVVNKLDTPGNQDDVHDFWPLGLGEPWGISSLHGHGTGDLLDAIVDALPEAEIPDEVDAIDVAIIGRPNAGKSSLMNRLAGMERAIVSDVAGTTRDSLDVLIERDGTNYRLVDTAGLRRKSLIDHDVEYYGFVRAMRAIDRADVALLVVDSTIGITDQDQRIARFANERGCGMVILMNKWDLIDDQETRDELARLLEDELGFVSYAPVVRISALTGAKVGKIFAALDHAYASYSSEITTSALNRLLTEMREFGHTISKGGAPLKLRYATQTGVKPPVFTFFANRPKLINASYERYVENRLREAFDLTGTPVRLRFRQKD